MTTETKTETLSDVFDVHFRNENTKGKWRRLFLGGPRKDISECRKEIAEFGKQDPVLRQFIDFGKPPPTEFRIVKMTRTIIG